MTNTKSLWHERRYDAVCINGIFSMVLCKGIPRFVNETMWSKPAEHTLFKRKYSTRAGGHWFILMKRSLIKTTVVQIPHGTVAIGKIIPNLIDPLVGCLKAASTDQFSCPGFGPHEHLIPQYLGQLIGFSA